ncbi:hypothetical protein L596_023653 [Steinernema carpocapsae]|nr:hypothetical protein L596_023653 [Steinernema carpocapsae]
MDDRGDQLVKAFSEDDDGAEVTDDDDDEDGTPLERFHYNRKQMSQIVEDWFVRKHKFGTIKSKFRKLRQTSTVYRMKKYLDESKRLKEKEIKKELWQFGNFFFKI